MQDFDKWFSVQGKSGEASDPAPQKQFQTAAPPVAPGGRNVGEQPLITGDNNAELVTGSAGTGVRTDDELHADAFDKFKPGRDMSGLDFTLW